MVNFTGTGSINRDSCIASQVQQPNYKLPKKALAYAVSTIALAILATLTLVFVPQPFGVLFSVSLLSFGLATSIKTHLAYKENRAKAEYEIAMDIKDEDSENSIKWLEKAAIERFYTPAILKLAETTIDYDLKLTLITILQLPSHSRVVGSSKIRQLQAEVTRLGPTNLT